MSGGFYPDTGWNSRRMTSGMMLSFHKSILNLSENNKYFCYECDSIYVLP